MYTVFRSGERISVGKRHIIDTTDKVFYIDTGFVGMYVGSGKERRMLVTMKPGNVFPLDTAAKNPIWHSDTHYFALSDVTMYMISRKKFLRKDSLSKKELEQKFAKAVEGNTWLIERIINLLTFDVARRLYMRLLMLADFLDAKQGNTAVLDMPITYVDLAESIGTSRETVNRLMTSLQNNGIVSVEKRIITIQLLDKLEELYDSRDKSSNT